jgi:hypothetical protein
MTHSEGMAESHHNPPLRYPNLVSQCLVAAVICPINQLNAVDQPANVGQLWLSLPRTQSWVALKTCLSRSPLTLDLGFSHPHVIAEDIEGFQVKFVRSGPFRRLAVD